MLKYVILYLIAFVLNIPFGYGRTFFPEKTRRNFAIKMVLIHAPIPVVILARVLLGIPWKPEIVVLSITICIVGQVFGSKVVPRLLGKPVRSKEAAVDVEVVEPKQLPSARQTGQL